MRHLAFLALALTAACSSAPAVAPEAYRTPLERRADTADDKLAENLRAVCGADVACASVQRAAYDRSEALRKRAQGLRYDAQALSDPWVTGPFEPRQLGMVIDDIIWSGRRQGMSRDGRYDYVKAEQWASQAFEARGIRFVN